MRIDRIKLAAVLAKKDMTVKTLAQRAELCRATVSNVKRGAACSAQSAGRIARALGVDVTEIIEQEE